MGCSRTAAVPCCSATRRSGRFYLHDSPYTYFTSADLHLGEISLECSRAGAVGRRAVADLPAAATHAARARPGAGRGPPGRPGLGAADRAPPSGWSSTSAPELDIVSYFPAAGPRLAAIDEASARMLADGMANPAHPVFLSTLRDTGGRIRPRHPVRRTRDGARIVRSVLMKPESECYVPQLHTRVERLAAPRQP